MLLLALLTCWWLSQQALAYDMVPRWGHAATFLPSPPALLIHGGKTDAANQFAYSVSPNSPDLILLPLDTAWSTDSPPYQLISSTSPSPAYAFHALSTVSTPSSSESVNLLVFGGDGGVGTPNPTGSDSAWTLSLAPGPTKEATWTHPEGVWANQPSRRRYLSSATHEGSTWIIGGEAPDGSGAIFNTVYRFSVADGFLPGPSLPMGIFHHVSVMLPNGTLIVFGGASMSFITGMAALVQMDRIYVLDTTASGPSWEAKLVAGVMLPEGRRGASGVMVGDDKVWIFGGADARLGNVLEDAWQLDLGRLTWERSAAPNGPSGRYDHIAVASPGGQIVLFGGFGETGPADAATHVFDPSSNTWADSFNPSPAKPDSTIAASESATTASATSSIESVISTDSLGQTVTVPVPTGSTSPTATSSDTALPRLDPGLSVPIQIGIVLGSLALLGSLLLLIICLCRRRKNRRVLEAAKSWDAEQRGIIESSGRAKPFDQVEKGWTLGASVPPSPPSKDKYGVIGLGMGAIGAGISGFNRVASRIASNPRNQYAALHDEGPSPTDALMSPKKDGSTIRLIGPRSMPDAPSRATSPRVNMLEEDDVRSFAAIREESEPETIAGRAHPWRPAGEILSQDDSDPFEDEPLIAPSRIPGGPVPSPKHSRANLDPFGDTSFDIADMSPATGAEGPDSSSSSSPYRLPALTRSDPLDLAGLLVPRLRDDSLPRSHRSSMTAASSDVEEGTIHHAQHASPTAASLLISPNQSPIESEGVVSPMNGIYAPIKRNESFFRRMTAGGITGLLHRSDSQASARQTPPIRDPAVPPALWPLSGASDDGHVARHPPSSWNDDLERPPRIGRMGENLSVSSLQSARSMRDMVIIQREESDSTIESHAIVEQVTGSSVQHSASDAPMVVTDPAPPTFATAAPSTPHKLRPVSTPSAPPSASSSKTATTTRSEPPTLPAGSPLPPHLVSHRRPVKDMVFSINKRSSRVFPDASAAVLSPDSEYSPQASPRSERPSTMYETARKSPLTIANPDAGRSSS